MDMKKVCLLGCGRLGKVIANGLLKGSVENMELTAVHVRSPGKGIPLAEELRCPVVFTLKELLNFCPDYVVEAAGNDAIRKYTLPILRAGSNIVALSTSAFGSPEFLQQVREAAEKADRHIYLAPGVIGGLDTIQAAALMGNIRTVLTKRKFPSGSQHSDASLDALADHFSGTAKDARLQYPDQLNIAVSLGLATKNPEAVEVRVEPGDCVDFTIAASGAFGKACFRVELGSAGPDLAAWSALALLQRLGSRVSF